MRSLPAALALTQLQPHYRPVVETRFWHSNDPDGYTTFSHARVQSIATMISAFELETQNDYHVQITLSNADNYFTNKNFKGYSLQLAFGAYTSEEEYYVSYTSQYEVEVQQNIDQPGYMATIITAIGSFNRLARETACDTYQGATGDGLTVKDLITSILTPGETGAGACFTGCAAFAVTFDSEDGLIDTVCPGKDFMIQDGDNRLQKVKELLGYTSCVMRQGSDWQIHILVPVTSGTTYDSQYALNGELAHKFFNQSNRKRLVNPNLVTVISSHEIGAFSGTATHTDHLISKVKKQYVLSDITSNSQAAQVSEAVISHALLNCDSGEFVAPMNFGQELWDYILVSNSRTGENKAGNVQYIARKYDSQTGQFTILISFGPADSVVGSKLAIGNYVEQQDPNYMLEIMREMWTDLQDLATQVESLTAKLKAGGGYALVPQTDMKDGHIDVSGLTTDAAVLPIKTNIVFEATGYRSFISYAGIITLADGTTRNVNAFAGGLYSSTRWVYVDLDEEGDLDIRVEGDFSAAATQHHVLLAIFAPNTDTDKMCALVPAQGGGSRGLAFIVAASNIVATNLAAITADLGLVNAGEFRLGNGNNPGSGFTGIRIYKSGSTCRVEGIYSDTTQVYFDSDGKFYAGAGSLILDADGMRVYTNNGSTLFRIIHHVSEGVDYTASFYVGNTGNLIITSYGTIYLENEVVAHGSILPEASATYGLGSNSYKWNTGYFTWLYPDNLRPQSSFCVPVAASDPSNPGEGYMYYNSATHKFRVADNNGWKDLG